MHFNRSPQVESAVTFLVMSISVVTPVRVIVQVKTEAHYFYVSFLDTLWLEAMMETKKK